MKQHGGYREAQAGTASTPGQRVLPETQPCGPPATQQRMPRAAPLTSGAGWLAPLSADPVKKASQEMLRSSVPVSPSVRRFYKGLL